ncbi:hypothetical protein RFI_14945 [Reticulomyxa filosa]|uniref:SAM domain-containing protein n=1 Tax=Reticulomyxa filosa TaxID=46433 RepID=X6N876_RETFI|nr:hypothetical protein RFI_14945 [Reticulomyxa filosa]|eukprot:ETO22256.1 hypothetical protein RFI_14945 [Reticulomyxa filosa]
MEKTTTTTTTTTELLNPSDPEVQRVRASDRDRALLEQVWMYLTYPEQISNEKYRSMMEWLEGGKGFGVNNSELVTEWLQSKDCAWVTWKDEHGDERESKDSFCRIETYEEFAFRLAVLGFEQMVQRKLFHHPSFNRQNKDWIQCIGQSSIPNKFTSMGKASPAGHRQRAAAASQASAAATAAAAANKAKPNALKTDDSKSASKASTLGDRRISRKTSATIVTPINPDLHDEDDSGIDENGLVGSDEDFSLSVHLGGKRRKSKRLVERKISKGSQQKKRRKQNSRKRKYGSIEESASKNTALTKENDVEDENEDNWNEPANKKRKLNHNNTEKSRTSANNTPRVYDKQLDVIIPTESNLDLNDCHLWSEDHVATWLHYMNDWGKKYVQAFMDNGVDGRILLEYDINVVCDLCKVSPQDRSQFILAVNQLRSVRTRCLGFSQA